VESPGHGTEETLVHLALYPIGVGRKRRILRKHIEAGKKSQASIHGPEVIVAVALVAGKL